MEDPQFQYVQGQTRPGFPSLLAEYEAESLAAVAAGPCALDRRYGPSKRQTFDFFPARGRARGTLAYFHAGYWQSRDKSTFRFIAPAFADMGLNVALVNYPLCPSVSLPALVVAANACVPAIHLLSAESAADALPLVLAGHSAGAHIAVELALADNHADSKGHAIDGVVALSGIFDLAPLVETSLNDKLRLDAASAAACSPLHRVRAPAAPMLVVVGEEETPAFVDQSRRLHEAWTDAGNRSALHLAPRADHFSLLRHFASPVGPLFEEVDALIASACHRGVEQGAGPEQSYH
ncbi:alpha/beta hydrolase [Variovorax sp. J31P207]|uniref:alpha/beta hydrolase n=1 Tax=Variovorax sp. J31P207 TaxID=3053510 RepID=UPI0025779F87|nr:alpha/beta hydrolase [Variovorax sp. J31P207]MDM0066797.1 alpha/beta hydrolase [Variovorax sp. J31P207]